MSSCAGCPEVWAMARELGEEVVCAECGQMWVPDGVVGVGFGGEDVVFSVRCTFCLSPSCDGAVCRHGSRCGEPDCPVCSPEDDGQPVGCGCYECRVSGRTPLPVCFPPDEELCPGCGSPLSPGAELDAGVCGASCARFAVVHGSLPPTPGLDALWSKLSPEEQREAQTFGLAVCRACGDPYPALVNEHGERCTHGCQERLQDVGIWELRCPECGEGPGDAPSGAPQGPISWFDDAVEFPTVWDDPDSVVCCCACGTFFELGADGALLPTEQV